MYMYYPLIVGVLIVIVVIGIQLFPMLAGGRRPVSIPPIIGPEGLVIPIYDVVYGDLNAIFRKKNGFGWPNFTLFDDRLKFKARDHTPFWASWSNLFRQWVEKEVLFSGIVQVSFRRNLWLNYLSLSFEGDQNIVYMQLNPGNLKRLLEFLRDKKLNLSDAALNFLSRGIE